MLPVACSRSTNTWNWGPEYSFWSWARWGQEAVSPGLALVFISTRVSFLIWSRMQRQTVCPWQIGLSLLSCSTMLTCASLVMGRMNPLVMLRYSTLQLKVIPWNLMLLWQKSMVYFPRGTARFTSSKVAIDSPANSPILALSTICLQIFSATFTLGSDASSSTSMASPSTSFSSLGSSTWSLISHMMSSLPRSSTVVSMMMSCLLTVELLMRWQGTESRGRPWWVSVRSGASPSSSSFPQLSPLQVMAPIWQLQPAKFGLTQQRYPSIHNCILTGRHPFCHPLASLPEYMNITSERDISFDHSTGKSHQSTQSNTHHFLIAGARSICGDAVSC